MIQILKTNRLILVIRISFVMLISSCGENFVDIAPESRINSENFYRNETEIEQAVIAAYAALQSRNMYAQNFLYFMEGRSDNAVVEDINKNGGEEGDIDLFRESVTNTIINNTWATCYTAIQRCNIVFNRIDDIAMDEALKDIRKGEVSFLRALTYFNLVRLWGAVPLVTNEILSVDAAYDHTRQSVEQVYTQIISDLQFAVGRLPALQSDVGRVTQGAALTLLGKVYLTRGEWDLAVTTLNEVSGYALLHNYADVFDVANENNAESIFEIQFVSRSDGEGSLFLRLHTPSNNTTLLGGVGSGGVGDNLPSDNLVAAFDPLDGRAAVTIDSLDDGRYHTRKYNGLPADTNDEDNNFMVLRYADVLLMLAEALNEQAYVADGPAFAHLNNIRARAGLAGYSPADLPDQESFRQAVWAERRLELAFENHRWFDLVRTNQYVNVMSEYVETRHPVVVREHHRYFPIPQSQIDLTNGGIDQNDGY